MCSRRQRSNQGESPYSCVLLYEHSPILHRRLALAVRLVNSKPWRPLDHHGPLIPLRKFIDLPWDRGLLARGLRACPIPPLAVAVLMKLGVANPVPAL